MVQPKFGEKRWIETFQSLHVAQHYADLLLPLPNGDNERRTHVVRALANDPSPPPDPLTVDDFIATGKNVNYEKRWGALNELARWNDRRLNGPNHFKLRLSANKLNVDTDAAALPEIENRLAEKQLCEVIRTYREANTSVADTAVWKEMAKAGPWEVEYATPAGMPDINSSLHGRSVFHFKLQNDVNYVTGKVWLKRCADDPEMTLAHPITPPHCKVPIYPPNPAIYVGIADALDDPERLAEIARFILAAYVENKCRISLLQVQDLLLRRGIIVCDQARYAKWLKTTSGREDEAVEGVKGEDFKGKGKDVVTSTISNEASASTPSGQAQASASAAATGKKRPVEDDDTDSEKSKKRKTPKTDLKGKGKAVFSDVEAGEEESDPELDAKKGAPGALASAKAVWAFAWPALAVRTAAEGARTREKSEKEVEAGVWYLPLAGSPVEVQITETGAKILEELSAGPSFDYISPPLVPAVEKYPAFVALETIRAQGPELFVLQDMSEEEKDGLTEEDYDQMTERAKTQRLSCSIAGCDLNIETTTSDGKPLPLGLHELTGRSPYPSERILCPGHFKSAFVAKAVGASETEWLEELSMRRNAKTLFLDSFRLGPFFRCNCGCEGWLGGGRDRIDWSWRQGELFPCPAGKDQARKRYNTLVSKMALEAESLRDENGFFDRTQLTPFALVESSQAASVRCSQCRVRVPLRDTVIEALDAEGHTLCTGCFGSTGTGRYNVQSTLYLRKGDGRVLVGELAKDATLQGLSNLARGWRGKTYRPHAIVKALSSSAGAIKALCPEEWAIVEKFIESAVKGLEA